MVNSGIYDDMPGADSPMNNSIEMRPAQRRDEPAGQHSNGRRRWQRTGHDTAPEPASPGPAGYMPRSQSALWRAGRTPPDDGPDPLRPRNHRARNTGVR